MLSPHINGAMQSWRTRARYTSLAAMLTALLLAGCAESESEVAPVSGRVSLDGRPFLGARLRFQPEAKGGSPSYGSTDQEGRFELGYKRGQKGALIGWHVVRIESAADALPSRYNVQSELRREVQADGDNNFDFDLKSEPK